MEAAGAAEEVLSATTTAVTLVVTEMEGVPVPWVLAGVAGAADDAVPSWPLTAVTITPPSG